ncbi:alkaline phosphatase family protein [Nonomuraea sp. SBT364]|uniref:alkaline phosphatase family protein n=1 Tax=Nonomuraea sp. SBT364 TaxID=1580530 RepID=UPI00066BF420|nr:nucleotide pyrophosphatase/phosphodiesterase family protein [Nonomuraea sp. SBT364]
MRRVPLVPAYGGASLPDLARSLLAALGLDEPNPLAIAPATRTCLFLVDGLGAELLRAHAGTAPFLTAAAESAAAKTAAAAAAPARAAGTALATPATLTAGFPATTVTSLCSLGTGLPPGEHGMLGLTLAVPGAGRLFNCLRWTGMPMDPAEWQPSPTVYQRAAAAGIEPAYVAPAEFEGSGLTGAVYRGVRYAPAETADDRVTRALAELARPRAHVTVYYGDLDAAGHLTGWGSDEWLRELAIVDRMAARLAEGLPDGAALYVTADHGMVNATDKLDAEATPELTRGVAMLGGEARARHVYAEPGAAADVLDAWEATLRGRAWVVPREEAVEAGWFGPKVRDEWLGRIGDVVAVPYTDLAIIAPAAHRIEALFTGYHGSMTAAEQLVPLVEVSRR